MPAEPRSIPKAFARLAAEGADAERIAAAAFATWRNIEAALSPIIGLGGVSALYRRSVYLSRESFPFLAVLYDGALGPSDFAALQLVLSRQSSKDAAAASGTLLQTFHDLLTNLIGESLSERLLKSIWDSPSSGLAAPEQLP